jgi:hypothetical protein
LEDGIPAVAGLVSGRGCREERDVQRRPRIGSTKSGRARLDLIQFQLNPEAMPGIMRQGRNDPVPTLAIPGADLVSRKCRIGVPAFRQLSGLKPFIEKGL